MAEERLVEDLKAGLLSNQMAECATVPRFITVHRTKKRSTQMICKVGDKVRIKSKNQIGYVCDIMNNRISVDCYGFMDDDDLLACILDAEELDLEILEDD